MTGSAFHAAGQLVYGLAAAAAMAAAAHGVDFLWFRLVVSS